MALNYCKLPAHMWPRTIVFFQLRMGSIHMAATFWRLTFSSSEHSDYRNLSLYRRLWLRECLHGCNFVKYELGFQLSEEVFYRVQPGRILGIEEDVNLELVTCL